MQPNAVVDARDIASPTTGPAPGRTGSQSDSEIMDDEDEATMNSRLGGWWAGGPSADTLFAFFTPVSDLSLAHVLPYFDNESDEKAFRLHRWYSNQRTIVVSVVLYLLLVILATFVEDIDGYQTAAQLVVVVVGRLLPVVVATAWALRLRPPPSWFISWPVVASVCVFLTTISFPLVNLLCVVEDESEKTRSCVTLDAGIVPWVDTFVVIILPYFLTLALHVQWRSVSLVSTLATVAYLAFIMPFVDSERVALPVLSVVVLLALSLFNMWNVERHLRLVFRRETSMRRKLSSLIQYNVGKVVKLESQQRLTELIKNSCELFMECDLSGVIQFASPGAKALLAMDADDLIGMHITQMRAEEDKDKVQEALNKVVAEVEKLDRLKSSDKDAALSQIKVRTQFRRQRKDGSTVLVSQEAHPVKMPGRDHVIFIRERKCTAEDTAPQATTQGSTQAVSSAPVRTKMFSMDPSLTRSNIALLLTLRACKHVEALYKENISSEKEEQGLENIVVSMAQQCWEDLWLSYTCNVGNVNASVSEWEMQLFAEHMTELVSICKLSSVECQITENKCPMKGDLSRTLAGVLLLLHSIHESVQAKDSSKALKLTWSKSSRKSAEGEFCSLFLSPNSEGAPNGWSKGWLEHTLLVDPLDYMADGIESNPSARTSKYTDLVSKAGISCSRIYLAMCSINLQVHGESDNSTDASLEITIPVNNEKVHHVDPFYPSENFGKQDVASLRSFPEMIAKLHPVQQRPQQQPESTPQPQLKGTHVLFVDDEKVNRRLGARMLNRLGCTYRLLEDGDEVWDALKSAETTEKPFSVIVIDIIMQRTDGAEVCRELRDKGVDIPIIAMTGNTAVRDVQRFLQVGFDMMLAKPFNIMGLARALEEAPKRREKSKEQKGTEAQ